MYQLEDDYGTSYFYRGAKSYVNNNLIFAKHQWKIIRINGNGSIRLMYNGTCPNNSCSINDTAGTSMGGSQFNPSDIAAKYLGYMYGGPYGSASISRAQAVTNETNITTNNKL